MELTRTVVATVAHQDIKAQVGHGRCDLRKLASTDAVPLQQRCSVHFHFGLRFISDCLM
jgi:hypothetical protein